MFDWYQRESGQQVLPEVVDRLFAETRGQPGLVGWLGELLTEEHNSDKSTSVGLSDWQHTYVMAQNVLPNNTIMNLVAKARDPAYKPTLLRLFETRDKMPFTFDNQELGYLYTHGHIDYEMVTEAQGPAARRIGLRRPAELRALLAKRQEYYSMSDALPSAETPAATTS